MRPSFILAAALVLAAPAFAPPALADKAADRARQLDLEHEAFLIGTWTYSKADSIGTRVLHIRFDKTRTASIRVSGDSNILPGPMTAEGVFWKVHSISQTAFFLEIVTDQLMGGGMHDLKRQDDGTLIDGDGTVWSKLP